MALDNGSAVLRHVHPFLCSLVRDARVLRVVFDVLGTVGGHVGVPVDQRRFIHAQRQGPLQVVAPPRESEPRARLAR